MAHGQGDNLPGFRFDRRTLRSLAVVGASLGVALAIYLGYVGSPLVQVVAEWTARWAGSALNLLGSSTQVDGTILSSDAFAVNIVAECTAVGPLVLFMGAVVVYPSPLRDKGFGLMLGIAVLTAVNLVRVMSLFWIGSAYPQYLSVAHLLVWQTAIVLLAIGLWLLWIERFAHARYR